MDNTTLIIRFLARSIGASLVLVSAFEHGCVYLDFALHVHVPEAARTVENLVEIGKRQVVIYIHRYICLCFYSYDLQLPDKLAHAHCGFGTNTGIEGQISQTVEVLDHGNGLLV